LAEYILPPVKEGKEVSNVEYVEELIEFVNNRLDPLEEQLAKGQ
jgi:hypothetical protein